MFAGQGVAQGRGPHGGHHVEFAHNNSVPAALDPDTATHVCGRPAPGPGCFVPSCHPQAPLLPAPRKAWQPRRAADKEGAWGPGSSQTLFSGCFPPVAEGRKERRLEPGVDPSQLLGPASGAEVGGGLETFLEGMRVH